MDFFNQFVAFIESIVEIIKNLVASIREKNDQK